MNIKIDLHTHSILSPDGGLSENDYKSLLLSKTLDVIAVTDHNRIDFAEKLQRKLGERIIVGEEINTTEGEIIGLFLNSKIESGLSSLETVKQISKQNGLVCIPHPFEILRKGISEQSLCNIIKFVDIIEVFNGRSMQPQTRKLAQVFISTYKLTPAANSDAHCKLGIGKTYNLLTQIPSRKNLVSLLEKGTRNEVAAPWFSYLCPKWNKIKRIMSS